MKRDFSSPFFSHLGYDDPMKKESHFGSKSVLDHLKAARAKGKAATEAHHALEAPGHLMGGADGARESALVILVISILFHENAIPTEKMLAILSMVMFALILWRSGRGALLGWNRLERLDKLVADEKYEIEHNREEEKAELTEMYRAKGFSEPLLTKVIDVLMADDNKLLGVMLEEELGVSLESYEHPLKQALGSGVGVFLASSALIGGFMIDPFYGPVAAAYIVIFVASAIMAKIEKIQLVNAVIWNMSLTFMATMGAYFLTKFLR